MSDLTLENVQRAVLDAGFEVFRVDGPEIRIAERVRAHLMDSWVSVRLDEAAHVRFTVRTQRSDFPFASAEELFEKAREMVVAAASERGFHEVDTNIRRVTDPMDESNVLDVWHELTYDKATVDTATLVDEVQWALGQPKCVA